MVQILQKENLPNGWTITKLGSIITPIKGKKPKTLGEKTSENKFPYINIEELEKKTFNKFTSDDSCPQCTENDVLMVWDGARSGLVGIGVSGVIGSTFMKLQHYGIDSYYLYYFLKMNYQKINLNPRGSGIPHVRPALLWNLEFPLPPLNEQKRITQKIKEYISKIDSTKKLLDNTKLQLELSPYSLLMSTFDGKLTEKWRKKNPQIQPARELLNLIIKEANKSTKKSKPFVLYDISEHKIPSWINVRLENLVYTSGRIGWRGLKAEEYTERGPLLLSVYNLNKGDEVDFQDVNHISRERYEESPEIQLEENDILLVKDGAGIGKIGIVKNLSKPATVNSSLLVIRPHKAFLPKFLFYFFKGPNLQKIARERITGSATPHLFQKDIKKFILSLAPLEEQKQIVSQLDDSFSKIGNTQNIVNSSLQTLETMRMSVLKQAFEGKLVSQDPNDESASVLLEKLKKKNPKLVENEC